MKSTFFIILLFFAVGSHAQQNLIPNPSFEEYTECPVQNEIGQGDFMKCVGWWYPHSTVIGSPDYFNRCNNSVPTPNTGIVGVPNNFWGYQEAFDGDGYVGFGALNVNVGSVYGNEIEIIATRIESLKSCREYKFSARVSLANLSSHSVEKLGIYLSRDSLVFDEASRWIGIQATKESTYLLNDTLAWMLLEFSFDANGGEEYLYFGYFNDYDSLEWQLNDSSFISANSLLEPYYYVDSVSLIEVGEVENCLILLPNIFTPNGDGVNDVLNISFYGLSHLYIYNRWGNLIMELNESNPIWDGRCKGQDCSEGIYYYIGEYESQQLKGTIQLVR